MNKGNSDNGHWVGWTMATWTMVTGVAGQWLWLTRWAVRYFGF